MIFKILCLRTTNCTQQIIHYARVLSNSGGVCLKGAAMHSKSVIPYLKTKTGESVLNL